MYSPIPLFRRNSPDDAYSFNVNSVSSSSGQNDNFSLHSPVQGVPLAFTTDWIATTSSPQNVPLDTASQFDWHFPLSTMPQPAYGQAVLPVNPGPEAAQLQDNQLFVETSQSQGYIVEHSMHGDAIPPPINQSRPLQYVRRGEVSQTTVSL
jgi:hypothetical protein